MVTIRQDKELQLREPAPAARRTTDLPVGAQLLVATLTWGLGDVLLSTSAIREFKRQHPDIAVVYRTYTAGANRKLQYKFGAPSQMLDHNPDIERVVDVADRSWVPDRPYFEVEFKYASFGGPALDYSIQAHYWENLGLPWETGQRFDAYYYPREHEVAGALATLGGKRSIVLTPGGGWPGKMWTIEGWREVIAWALDVGIQPVILAGERIDAAGFLGRGILNLSGSTDIREAAAILAATDYAVMTEGGPSNIRFAVGRPAFLLTCATQSGVQVWTPPELTREIRLVDDGVPVAADLRRQPHVIGGVACDPCMWRGVHVERDRGSGVPPASIRNCPKGRSLRDLPAEFVIEQLEREVLA